MSFRRIIFNFNPLNGNYFKPPFFPIQELKRKKRPFQRALKIFAKEQFIETFFWGTWGCTDSEKLKILLWGLLSHKGPFLEFYNQTSWVVLTTSVHFLKPSTILNTGHQNFALPGCRFLKLIRVCLIFYDILFSRFIPHHKYVYVSTPIIFVQSIWLYDRHL